MRAVHLELVDSLSADETLLALRRFFARRGMSSIIWSDNAKGFVNASSRLLEMYGPQGPTWKFIAPRAPWWGGWWERLIGVVKSSLRKTLGRQCLCRQELETVLIEIEGCVNARPLTFVGDDFESKEPLTPSHFLLGRDSPSSRLTLPKFNPSDLDQKSLVKLLEQKNAFTQQFWTVWKDEYLRNLPPYKGEKQGKEFKVGSVVLIEGEGSRLYWPLGLVDSIYRGKDGLVRTVSLKTAKGFVTRPIQRHELEILASDSSLEADLAHPCTKSKTPTQALVPIPSDRTGETSRTSGEETEPKTTRSGRAVRERQLLDL